MKHYIISLRCHKSVVDWYRWYRPPGSGRRGLGAVVWCGGRQGRSDRKPFFFQGEKFLVKQMRMNNKGGGQRRCWRQGRGALSCCCTLPALIAISTIGHLVIVNQSCALIDLSQKLTLGYFPAAGRLDCIQSQQAITNCFKIQAITREAENV